MRIANRGLRNRNAEDSYETVCSNERRSIPMSAFYVPQSAIRNPHFSYSCSAIRDPQSAFLLFLFRNPQSAIRISHLLGCTFAATFSRSPFKEMNPVASDWL